MSVTILKHECSWWDISILHMPLTPFHPKALRRRKAAHTHWCMLETCSSPCTSMKVHKQLISVLSWAMKLFPISPSHLLPSSHLRGEQGTHLLLELSKRLPNPIPAEDQGLAVRKALHCLLQALAHGFVKKGNVCASLDVAAGHLGGHEGHPCVQGTGKEKRLFNMTWIEPVTTALPMWGDYQPAHDTGNIWCTFLNHGNHRQLLQWVKIRKISKRTWKVMQWFGAHGQPWNPQGRHMCVCTRAGRVSIPPWEPGEGACTSPGTAWSCIIHLHWKLHRHDSLSRIRALQFTERWQLGLVILQH